MFPPSSVPDVEVLEAVHEYVGQWREWFTDAPPVFSSRWFDLAEDDPRRDAAVVLAAWARWCEETGLGARVRRVLVEASHDLARAFRDYGVAHRCSFAELSARRPSTAPRPGDHPGGPVPVWGADT